MIEGVVRRLLANLGYVPAVEAAREQEFETSLAMLLPDEGEREKFRQGYLMLAKAGITCDDMEWAARALALGYYPEERHAR